MSYLSLLIHDVLILNPDITSGGEDEARYGDEGLAYDGGTASKARVVQESSTEDTVDRDLRVQTFKVFLPPSAPVGSLSLLQWAGRELRVVGEPVIANAATPNHHVEVRAQEVIG